MFNYFQSNVARINDLEAVINILDSYRLSLSFTVCLRVDSTGAVFLQILANDEIVYAHAVKWAALVNVKLSADEDDQSYHEDEDDKYKDLADFGFIIMLKELGQYLDTTLSIVGIDCDGSFYDAQEWRIEPGAKQLRVHTINGHGDMVKPSRQLGSYIWIDPRIGDDAEASCAWSHLEYVGPQQAASVESRVPCQEESAITVSRNDIDKQTDVKAGCYRKTDATTYRRTKSVLYRDYCWWRDQLALFAHGVTAETIRTDPTLFQGRPFVELICTSFGYMGSATCAKLAQDFAAQAEEAHRFAIERYLPSPYFDNPEEARVVCQAFFASRGRQWFEQYQALKRVFQLGAEGGLVHFQTMEFDEDEADPAESNNSTEGTGESETRTELEQ